MITVRNPLLLGVLPYNEPTLEGTWPTVSGDATGTPPCCGRKILSLADAPQEGLLADATAFRDANIVDVASYDELRSAIEEGKWARGPWAGDDGHAMHCLSSCMPARLSGRLPSLSTFAFVAALCL